MTSGRLGVLIVVALHEAGYIAVAEGEAFNPIIRIAQQVIDERVEYGDVSCTPDEDEHVRQ